MKQTHITKCICCNKPKTFYVTDEEDMDLGKPDVSLSHLDYEALLNYVNIANERGVFSQEEQVNIEPVYNNVYKFSNALIKL